MVNIISLLKYQLQYNVLSFWDERLWKMWRSSQDGKGACTASQQRTLWYDAALNHMQHHILSQSQLTHLFACRCRGIHHQEGQRQEVGVLSNHS